MSVGLHKDTVSGDPSENVGTNGRLDANIEQSTYDNVTTTIVNVGLVGTVLAAANPDRKFLSVSINCMTATECMAVRYYPAATDNDFQGVEVLARNVTGNNSLFNPTHFMQQTNIYTGEVSGVSDAGTVEVSVTEGF